MSDDSSLVREMLEKSKTIAVVGISDRPDRPSYMVTKRVQPYYEIIPVNPQIREWEGMTCYPSLLDIPEDKKIDMVNIFRRSNQVMPVVEEAVKRKVPYIWMQQGIINEEAARFAEENGSKVVMDVCLAVALAMLRR